MRLYKTGPIALPIALALLVTACGSSEDDQLGHVDGPNFAMEVPAEGDILVGGWVVVAIDDPEILAAAQFAARTGADIALTEVIAAQQQIVAGVNYNLTIMLADESLWQAQVFHSLDGEMELTSFDPG